MAIKQGWDFPTPSNASTRAYTRERGAGTSDVTRDPPPNTDQQGTGRPYSRTRNDPRAGRYAPGIEFTPVAQDKNEDAELTRTGRQATQTHEPKKFAKGGAVKKG